MSIFPLSWACVYFRFRFRQPIIPHDSYLTYCCQPSQDQMQDSPSRYALCLLLVCLSILLFGHCANWLSDATIILMLSLQRRDLWLLLHSRILRACCPWATGASPGHAAIETIRASMTNSKDMLNEQAVTCLVAGCGHCCMSKLISSLL